MAHTYDTMELAKKVRARAAEVIQNESLVIQNDERRVQEATDVINLCNIVLKGQVAAQSNSQWDR